MGTLRIDIEIENPAEPGRRETLRLVRVDTGAELSWFPARVLDSLSVERRKRERRAGTGYDRVQARWVWLATTSSIGRA